MCYCVCCVQDKLLVLNPNQRLTVDQAIVHPYCNVYHDPEDEPTTSERTRLLPLRPLLSNGVKIDFVNLIATMPLTCIGGDTSSQSQENCRAIAFVCYLQRSGSNTTWKLFPSRK